jgi:hypothetical protein
MAAGPGDEKGAVVEGMKPHRWPYTINDKLNSVNGEIRDNNHDG